MIEHMAGFQNSLKRVLELEGGYSDDPNDKGGNTNFGITERVYNAWLSNDSKPLRPVIGITVEEVALLYYSEFWIQARCNLIEEFSWPLADEVFETSVNCGPGIGVVMVQQAFNSLRSEDVPPLVNDGRCGPLTLHALRRMCEQGYEDILVRASNCQQYIYYCTLLDKDPVRNRKYIRGWMKRISLSQDWMTVDSEIGDDSEVPISVIPFEPEKEPE